jgi:hypothetical protein
LIEIPDAVAAHRHAISKNENRHPRNPLSEHTQPAPVHTRFGINEQGDASRIKGLFVSLSQVYRYGKKTYLLVGLSFAL